MQIYMLGTAAGPEFVLQANQVYDVSRAVAKQFLHPEAGGLLVGIKDGQPKYGPAAEIYDPQKHDRPGQKRTIHKLPVRPDPLDVPQEEIDEEYMEIND